MLMKKIMPLAELSWVSFYSLIENLDVCFSFPLIVYTEVFRSRTATVFLTVCIVPPLSLSLSSELSLYIFTVACHRLSQYGKSCSFINIFVSVLVFILTDIFLHVNPEVSVCFSTGRKIWKRHAKYVFNCRKV